MNLDTLVSDNYKEIFRIAGIISGRKNRNMAGDLVSETFVELKEKNKKYEGDRNDFVKWYSAAMKNQFVWVGSSFNRIFEMDYETEIKLIDKYSKNYRAKTGKADHENQLTTIFSRIFEYEAIERPDHSALIEIEMGAEGLSNETRELIETSSYLGTGKTLKYIEVIEFKRGLAEYEKILFDLYFEKRLSTREIADMYSDPDHKMNYQSVNGMVNIIKQKIKTYKWKH